MKHIARKRFGQNFLTDDAVLSDIIRTIAPQKKDCMVEIGPGLGAMTERLLPGLEKLHVVELDRDLVARLQKRFPAERLAVHSGDALAFDFATLIPNDDTKLRIVGNLPYNISTPLLFHMCRFAPRVLDQHFMLQKEVVERMTAQPRSKAYGRLSVMLQWRYHMEYLFTVPPTAFDPAPKVHSAIVRMIPIDNPLRCNEAVLEKVVTQAFAQRRKTIRNSLSGLADEALLVATGIDPTLRPEAVSTESYIALANRLATDRTPAGTGPSGISPDRH